MSYNEKIDERVSRIVEEWNKTEKRNMFGGICYLLKGNMLGGVYKDFLFLRLGEKGAEEALRADHVKPFDVTGRPMKGWVMVEPEGFAEDEVLNEWLLEAKGFVETLPSQ
ncbi:MAG: TfoX/Sxy family protein [Nitrospirota bacterium]|nr:MAG: TfoX/Sxy family protein [Nitrospirota bacterium]